MVGGIKTVWGKTNWEKNNTAVETWTQDRFICQNSSTAPCVFLTADFSSDIQRSPNYEQDWVQIVLFSKSVNV